MADTPIPGRAKPVLERFEPSETGLSAHLTEEQKTWKVVQLRPRSERFEVLTARPTLVLKLHLTGACAGAAQPELTATVLGIVGVVSEAERALGGGGLTLADQRTEPATVFLTLVHSRGEGAAVRAAQLAEMLNDASSEPAADIRVKLHLVGSPLVSRCEVLPTAA